MKELQRLNREERGRASGAMCMFLTVNMTSLQLVTMNILAYRMEYGSRESGGDYRGGDCGNDAYDIGWYACGEGDVGGEGIAWGYC